jgi:membrane-associated phospholipid phosphatase
MNTVPHSPWAWLPAAVALLLVAIIHASGSNHELFLMINRFGHPLGDEVWANLTMLGDGAVALALVVPCIKRSPQCFWAALIAAVIAGLWVQVFKHAVSVPRPLAVFGPEQFFHSGPAFRAASFPSGHAAAIFAVTGIWIMGLARRYLLRSMLLMLAVLVSLSRIMVGVHWPLDILWGMLGGWVAAWSGLALYARWRWNTAGLGGLLAGIVLLIVAAALLVSRHIGYPAALPLQRVLGAICLVWGACEMIQLWPRMHLRLRPRREPKGE